MACAWTVTRALPGLRHMVVVLGRVTEATRAWWAPIPVLSWPRVREREVLRLGPAAVLMHNTAAAQCEPLVEVPTLQYVHSYGRPAPAMLTRYCSAGLARRYGQGVESVMYQGVSQPPGARRRAEGEGYVIGRLCTPVAAKWPAGMETLYAELAAKVPMARWEFVGCPRERQEPLQRACHGRATFIDAKWESRTRLWDWDVLLYANPGLPETFGRTVAEAMRCGCVPVVDAVGGFREQIEYGTGMLCGSPAAFAEALKTLQDRATWERYSEAARVWGGARFGVTAFAERLLGCLLRLTGDG